MNQEYGISGISRWSRPRTRGNEPGIRASSGRRFASPTRVAVDRSHGRKDIKKSWGVVRPRLGHPAYTREQAMTAYGYARVSRGSDDGTDTLQN